MVSLYTTLLVPSLGLRTALACEGNVCRQEKEREKRPLIHSTLQSNVSAVSDSDAGDQYNAHYVLGRFPVCC